ncbi:MAG: PhzF family phenazine biosynthesis isomerase, partial [Bradyrhizobium sp.]|nr:PhzF family phenazine biosynthesis isomerase [Bradyrhizobium sp.]
GLVPIEILRVGSMVVGSKLASPQPLVVGPEVASELVASACGIPLADIETVNHRPRIASCGAPFILAELKNRTALIGASPNGDVFRLEVSKQPAVSIMLYAQVHEADIDVRARMFAPHLNIPEDPATGAANVALIGLLASLRPEANLSLSKTIAQGVEMGRPSILQAEAEKNDGTVTATYIGGRCVPVMSGTIDLA